jgi:glycosyltransferase involved in cell wall biosynthesis
MENSKPQPARIPRILHSVHLDSTLPSPVEQERIRSWLANHPGWEYHHWTTSELPPSCSGEFFPSSQLAELVKYDALFHFGGIYFDLGIECIKNFESLIEDIEAFWSYERTGEISGALIGVTSSHPLIARIFRDLQLGLAGSEPNAKTCHELLNRAMLDYLGSNRKGFRLEVADTGRDLGGLFNGNLALFSSWVFFQRPLETNTSLLPSGEHFAVDYRCPASCTAPRIVGADAYSSSFHQQDPHSIGNACPSLQPVLALVIPTLNRGDLLAECLASIEQQLDDVEKVWVIDNGRQNIISNSTKISVLKQPGNLGVAASWNLGLRLSFASPFVSHALVLNDDVCLGPGQIREIHAVIRQNSARWMFVGPYYWSVWALSRQGAEAMELEPGKVFDENFYPAYFEDNDFYYRLTSLYPGRYLGEIPAFQPMTCRNSMSTERDPRVNVRFNLNRRYYIRKWGGLPSQETIAVTNWRAELYSMRGREDLMRGLRDLCNYVSNVLCRSTSELSICEIGSYSGESTEVFARRFRTVVAVDPWQDNYDVNDPACDYAPFAFVEEAFDSRMASFNNVVKIKATSDEAAKKLQGSRFDVVYIDGLHTYDQVKQDILNYLPLTTYVIAGHDLHEREWPGVHRAVLEMFGETVRVFVDTSWAKILSTSAERSRPMTRKSRTAQLNIITPFSRTTQNANCIYESLKAIARQIPTRWFIIYQHNTEDRLTAWREAVVDSPGLSVLLVKGKTASSYYGNSYRNQAILMLPSEESHWVYFLDDDNILHPDFHQLFDALDEEDEVVFFSQTWKSGKLRFAPINLEVGGVDTAMFLTRAPIIKHYQWTEDQYTADGILAQQLAKNHHKRLFFAPYCFYNYLA